MTPRPQDDRGKSCLGRGLQPLPGGGGIFKSAAVEVLRQERRLLSTGDITKIALERGFLQVQGKTPDATMASALYTDVRKKADASIFIRPTEGLFGLREWLEEGFYPEGMEAYADGAVYENFGGRKRNGGSSHSHHSSHNHNNHHHHREHHRGGDHHAAAPSSQQPLPPQAAPSRATPGRASKSRAAALWQAESTDYYLSDDDNRDGHDGEYRGSSRRQHSSSFQELSGARDYPFAGSLSSKQSNNTAMQTYGSTNGAYQPPSAKKPRLEIPDSATGNPDLHGAAAAAQGGEPPITPQEDGLIGLHASEACSPRSGAANGIINGIDLSLHGIGLGPNRGKPSLVVDISPAMEVCCC